MPVNRAAVALLAALAGCDEAPALCLAPDEPLRVAATGPARSFASAFVGDHVYYNVAREHGPTDTHVGPRCGAATRVIAGGYLRPARLHLDPGDDDPTLACELVTGHFFRVDLAGERAPELVHSDKSCRTNVTAHGAIVVPHAYHARKLWFYPDFPDTRGVLAWTGLRSYILADEILYTANDERVIERHDLGAGTRTVLVERAAWLLAATPTHALWLAPDAPPMTLQLTDARDGGSATIAFADPALADAEPSDVYDDWWFSPGGAHVLWTPRDVSPPRAFDLRGRELAFAAPGLLLGVVDDAAVWRADDGRYLAAEIGEPVVALDPVTVQAADDVTANLSHSASSLHPGRIEVVRAGVLWHVPLDGSPATAIGRVGGAYAWIDAGHLVTVRDGELVAVTAASGAERVLDGDVQGFDLPGADPAVDGLHYLVNAGAGDPRTGVWYLPPAHLLAD